jgi:hypothetical protein
VGWLLKQHTTWDCNEGPEDYLYDSTGSNHGTPSLPTTNLVSNGTFEAGEHEDNLVTNGGFDTDDNWSTSGCTIADGKVSFTNSGQNCDQTTGTFVTGALYAVTLEIDSYSSGDVKVAVGSYDYVDVAGMSSPGTYTTLVTAQNSASIFRIRSSVAGATFSVASASVVRVGSDATEELVSNSGFEDVTEGSELVTNGTFDSDLTGWTPGNASGTSGWVYGSGNAFMDPDAAVKNRNLYQSILTIGHAYTATVDIKSHTSGGLKIYIGSTYSESYNTTGIKTFSAVASNSSFILYGSSSELTVDDVSVKQLTLDNWSLTENGTSKVAPELTEVDNGTYACRFTVDGSNSTAGITQSILTSGQDYYVTVRAKAASGTPTIRITGDVTSDGDHELTTDWADYSTRVTANGTDITIQSLAATSSTIYIDSVSVVNVTEHDFDDWTEMASGSSSVSAEVGAGAYGGSGSSLKITSGADNGLAYVGKTILTPGHTYTYSFAGKASSTGGVKIGNASDYKTQPLTTSWDTYSLSSATTTVASFYVTRATASVSIYIDDVSVVRTGPHVGSTRGPEAQELVTNGGFDSGDNWSTTGCNIADGKVTFTESGQNCDQTGRSFVGGQDYQVTLEIEDYTGRAVALGVGSYGFEDLPIDGNGTWTFTKTAIAPGTILRLRGAAGLEGETIAVTNVSVVRADGLGGRSFDGSQWFELGSDIDPGTDDFWLSAWVKTESYRC